MSQSQETPDVSALPENIDPDDMIPVDADGDWIDLQTDEWLKGAFLGFQDGVGEYGSRMYRVLLAAPYDGVERGEVALFWGASSLNNKVDRGGVDRGRIVAIRKTSEEYETDGGNKGRVYDVKELREA